MKRRSVLKSMLAGAGAQVGFARAAKAAATGIPDKHIALYVDMMVDPAKEKQMMTAFNTQFKPTAMKHEGYIDVRILKLNKAIQGAAPAGGNYRFALYFISEDLRQKWINSADHQRVWPMIENCLTNKNYAVHLYDNM